MTENHHHPDGDEHKGAVEDDSVHLRNDKPERHGSLSGQLGHRTGNEEIKENDSDFPEPGSSPEHSGQHR